MAYQKRVLEVRGATVEAAIEAGLAKLGVKRPDVIVEIIEEGSSGILGLGRREAVVSLTTLVQVEETPPPAAPMSAPPTPSPVAPSVVVEAGTDAAESVEAARQVVAKLLELLHVQAHIAVDMSPPDELTGRRVPLLQIHGENLGTLIGPRGNILQALQFVARSITSQQLHEPAHFVIDVEGFRERRADMLVGLAERTAAKVVKEGYAIALNPMPPNERRIVHMTLRDNPDVTTKSEGEGEQRRVRIYPAHAPTGRPGGKSGGRPSGHRPQPPPRRR